MAYLVKALIGLSALAFVFALITNYGYLLPFTPTAEGFSRASANLALLAIALTLSFRDGRSA